MKKVVLLVVLIIFLIVVLFLIFGKTEIEGFAIKDGTFEKENKEAILSDSLINQECPYECCEGDDYKKKDCDIYSKCINNECVDLDSDSDGLTDREEIKYGTSSTNSDTDGDGLTDYIEVKTKGTDPTKQNTDNDRYNDNEDPNPLEKNSANIKVNIISSNEEPDIINIGLLSIAIAGVVLTEGALTPILSPFLDKIMYSFSGGIEIKNIGDDYSSYTDFDIIYLLSGEEVKKEKIDLNKLNNGESKIISFQHDIKLKDVPESLLIMFGSGSFDLESFLQDPNEWDISIENINYEGF